MQPATTCRRFLVLEIRLAEPEDEPFLWDMGWEATAVDDGMRALGRDGRLRPCRTSVAISTAGDGPAMRRSSPSWTGSDSARPGTASSRLRTRAGASWRPTSQSSPLASRLRRGAGVWGSALLDALLTLAREQGYRAVSLSVDRQNPARRLYERKGFRDAGISDPTDTSVTMIVHL